MANTRVQIPFAFTYPNSGSGELLPVVGTTVEISHRDPITGNPSTAATVYQVEASSNSATYSSLATDSGGNVPGWVVPGSYVVTALAQGGFAGASIAWEAVRGDGVTIVAAGAVDVVQLAADVQQALIPTGTILDYGGIVAPSGYVLADGSVYPIGAFGSTYFALSQALGGRWNTGGEGSGNFRVPLLTQRVAIGSGTGFATGVTGGVSQFTMANNQMPLHNHGGHTGTGSTPPSGTGGGTTGGGTTGGESNGHAHDIFNYAGPLSGAGSPYLGFPTWQLFSVGASGGLFQLAAQFTGTSYQSAGATGVTDGPNQDHSHGIPGLSIPSLSIPALSIPALSIGNDGGSSPISLMQPYAVTTKIIKL